MEVEGYTPADEWKRYVRPCDADGVEHDCLYEFIAGWDVESFTEWLLSERARIWDECAETAWGAHLIGAGSLNDLRGLNPYRKGGDS